MSTLSLLEITAVATPLAFVFGVVIGSFLNVLIWRLPREEKPNGRSHCPGCGHELVWNDLIPVLSFIFSAGRCRYCKKSISFRYPLIEIITGVLFALAIITFPLNDAVSWLMLIKAIFVIAICVTVFVIDFEHYLILDKVVFPAIAVVAGLLIATDISSGTTMNTIYGILAAVGVFIPFWFLWFVSKGKWMGFGDVKFMAFMGFALGFPGILVALFLSFGIGAITGVFLILAGKKQLSSRLPFGTFLSVATIIALLYGPGLWSLYWRLLSV